MQNPWGSRRPGGDSAAAEAAALTEILRQQAAQAADGDERRRVVETQLTWLLGPTPPWIGTKPWRDLPPGFCAVTALQTAGVPCRHWPPAVAVDLRQAAACMPVRRVLRAWFRLASAAVAAWATARTATKFPWGEIPMRWRQRLVLHDAPSAEPEWR